MTNAKYRKTVKGKVQLACAARVFELMEYTKEPVNLWQLNEIREKVIDEVLAKQKEERVKQ